MYQCLKATLVVLCVAVGTNGCDWAKGDGEETVSGGQTNTTARPTIESSLEDLAVLPPRIRWSATTSLPPQQIEKVLFFVDRSRWWIDSVPPYTYGPPDAYLPARWITSIPKRPNFRRSRTHDFMVRVKTTSGEKLDGAVVRLRAPQATRHRPPGGYASREYLRLSPADVANPPPPGSRPHYRTGFLVFVGSSLFVRGSTHDAAWEILGDRERVRLGTPIFFWPGAYAAVGSGFYGVDEVVCGPNGPSATYAWSQTQGRVIAVYRGVSEYARNLELRAVKDPCIERRKLLEGIWEEVVPG